MAKRICQHRIPCLNFLTWRLDHRRFTIIRRSLFWRAEGWSFVQRPNTEGCNTRFFWLFKNSLFVRRNHGWVGVQWTVARERVPGNLLCVQEDDKKTARGIPFAILWTGIVPIQPLTFQYDLMKNPRWWRSLGLRQLPPLPTLWRPPGCDKTDNRTRFKYPVVKKWGTFSVLNWVPYFFIFSRLESRVILVV